MTDETDGPPSGRPKESRGLPERSGGSQVTLTHRQEEAIEAVRTRLVAGCQSTTLGGLAGTGKTTVVGQISQVLGYGPDDVAFCAFTGKAATVINRKMAGLRATTIHRLIYRTVERHCRECPAYGMSSSSSRGGSPLADRGEQQNQQEQENTLKYCHGFSCGECSVNFYPKEKLPAGLRLIVVDEASMVPEVLYDHLMSYGVPVLWVGDHGQLPPVRSRAYLMEYPDIVLDRVHRTAADSPILKMAMKVRRDDRLPRPGRYADNVVVRRGGSFKVSASELHDGSVVVLVPTNRLRHAVNKAARKERRFDPEQPVDGDRVVCLRNNSQAGIFNGLTGTVVGIEASWVDLDFYDLGVAMDDDDFVYRGRACREQFLNLKTLHEVSRQEMDLWDYGYALTVHKAQGSEYPRVIVVADMSGIVSDHRRWLYTAVTRATEQLEIIYPE